MLVSVCAYHLAFFRQVFDEFQLEELKNYPFGLAVGSLEPLRGGNKNIKIIELIRGLQDSIPENRKNLTPNI